MTRTAIHQSGPGVRSPYVSGARGGEHASVCVSVSYDQAGLAGGKVMCPESWGVRCGWCTSNGETTGGAGMLHWEYMLDLTSVGPGSVELRQSHLSWADGSGLT